jgi:AcrR family transcriptional regulator
MPSVSTIIATSATMLARSRRNQGVAQQRGLEEATLREIAAEAGWSTGVLSHYFADKDDLVRFAFHLVVERASERYLAAAEAEDAAGRIRAALRETLPLDEERFAEAQVWLAFLGRSLSHPGLADERRAFYARWRASLAGLIEDGSRSGDLRRGLDPEAEATALIALVDGLALQAVSDPKGLAPARQQELLDAAVDQLRPAK